MKRYLWLLLVSLALAAQVFVPKVLSQVEQATITGTVTDQLGAVVPGARVVVTNIQTRAERETQTNTEGHYTVPFLRPGQYEVNVENQGFGTAHISGVNLTVGLTATIDVQLKPAALQTEEVTISASAVQLEQQNASLGNVVGSRQLTELPLLGRNPYSLVTLAPGVNPRGNAGSGPIINGGRSNTSEILLDGAETRNSTTNDISFAPPLETVQEFKVITNSMSSEFGRSGGGVLTAVTRSGTNDLHGSFYEFLRNDALNANSWANNRAGLPRSPFRRNEYGFSVGGPIVLPRFGEGGPALYHGRNKTFFFVNWEQTKQRSPDDLIATVPTALERAGDFSRTFDGRGNLIRIYDPATTQPDPARPGRFIRDQFSCNGRPNVICPDRLDPIALRVMQFYPLPNRTTLTQNFVQTGTRQDESTRLFFRIDHNLGTRHRLFFTYGKQDNPRFTPGLNEAFPGEGTNGERGRIESHPRIAVLGNTMTFRQDLIGEFRASVTRNVTAATPRSVGFDFTQLGFPASLRNQARSLLFPRFNISDVTSLGPDRASFFNDAEQATEFQNHLTWLRGDHSLRTGFDFTFQVFNVMRPERPGGVYEFSRTFTQGPDPLTSGSATGFGVATFLLGTPTGGSISDDPSLAASQKYYSLYLQDDWKVLSNLTLNLGLRWEYQTPWTDRFNQLAFFDPEFTDPLSKQRGLLRFVGRDGVSRYQSDPDKNNFAPRLGLAWQFMKDTVLRAGYGLFYFPGSGGIGAGASDLGSGFLVSSGVFLGQPPAAPNTPPIGASLANPFQAGFLPSPTTGLGGGITTAFRDWVTPFNHQWNLNIQRALTRDLLVEVAYVGSRGQRIWLNRNRNAVSTEFLSLGPVLNDLVPNPFFGLIPGGIGASRTVRRSQLLRPFPQYGDITRFRDPVGDSVYHGMTLRVDKRLSQGLTFQAAYTISKQIDNVQERFGGRTSIIDPNNLSLSRSVGDFDRPQILVLNYIYEFPFGPGKKWLSEGWAGRALGNWQISGITTFARGLPVVITGPSNTQLPGVGATALRLKSPLLPKDQRTLDRWFDTSAFAPAPPFSLGNDSRTQPDLRGPGIRSFDLSLSRNQRIMERMNLQFRAEFFNAFNTPQFGDPVGNVISPDFGRIISAGSPRQIQLGLRLTY